MTQFSVATDKDLDDALLVCVPYFPHLTEGGINV
jgi:hypothetical protein